MKNVEKDKTKIKNEIIANNRIIYKIKKSIKKYLHLKQFLNNYTQFQKEKKKKIKIKK